MDCGGVEGAVERITESGEETKPSLANVMVSTNLMNKLTNVRANEGKWTEKQARS